jgi:hypothetical protein
LLNNDICILNPIAIINILNKVGVFSEVFTPLKFYDTPIQGNYNAVVSSVNADCGGKTSFHIFSKDGTIPMLAPIKITNEPCEISNDTMCLFSSKNKDEVASFISYITTKLVRFLLLCRYHSYHNNNIETWRFVPSVENFNHAYTDSELYSVYNLNDEEINLIESIIKESSDTILMLK